MAHSLYSEISCKTLIKQKNYLLKLFLAVKNTDDTFLPSCAGCEAAATQSVGTGTGQPFCTGVWRIDNASKHKV